MPRHVSFAGLIGFLALGISPLAVAQITAPLAPWFDSDGFYNKPQVSLERATNDMTACRIEALRLKQVRNTHTQVGTAMAFNPDGTYNPVVSGAASGIASIMFAIQDARYNASIETVEFRDCAVSLGYRRFILGQAKRREFDASPDRGFASLVAAATPADGRPANAEPRDNYYDAALAARPYENVPAPQAIAQPAGLSAAAQPPPDPALGGVAIETASTVIERVDADQIAAPRDGMAIVVISARQKTGISNVSWNGVDFRFTRVTRDGSFLDLLQPSATFSVVSHRNAERRRDATLAGDVTASRYSTYVIPAGRYVLSDMARLNACLGTLTFEVSSGDVAYLGDYVLQTPGIPIASLLIPTANINTGMDNKLKSDLRLSVGDDLEAARAALQADPDAKGRLRRVSYQNGYRIPCSGEYVGRIANPGWGSVDARQADSFHDAMAAHAAAAETSAGH